MNKPLKSLWIRLKWILRKLSRRKRTKLPKEDQNEKTPQNPTRSPSRKELPKPEMKPETKPEQATKRLLRSGNALWKPLLKLAISLTELLRLIRLLISLIRKNWGGSAKS